MCTERAEAFFPLFDCSLPLAADRAREAAYFVVARRREACRLSPPQHGGARSGASDDDGGNPANIAASGASNQTERDCASSSKQGSDSPTLATQRRCMPQVNEAP
jgi:hypothetical protein